MNYVPLWVKSNYSFLEGASHPDELVEEAHRLGFHTMALTDRDGVYGMVRAHVSARELGVKIIVGSQVTLFDDTKILLYAMTRQGYGHLCRLLSQGRLRSPKGESRVYWREVCEHAGDVIAVLPFSDSILAREDNKKTVGDLRSAFGDRLHLLSARHRPEVLFRVEQAVARVVQDGNAGKVEGSGAARMVSCFTLST